MSEQAAEPLAHGLFGEIVATVGDKVTAPLPAVCVCVPGAPGRGKKFMFHIILYLYP